MLALNENAFILGHLILLRQQKYPLRKPISDDPGSFWRANRFRSAAVRARAWASATAPFHLEGALTNYSPGLRIP